MYIYMYICVYMCVYIYIYVMLLFRQYSANLSTCRLRLEGIKGTLGKGTVQARCDTFRYALYHAVFGPLPNGPLVPSGYNYH